jgi:hypothetical protein
VIRAAFGLVVLVSALAAPWPVTVGLAVLGAVAWPAYVEAGIILAVVEGAATPDRDGAAWLPLAAAALAAAGIAEIVRPLLTRGARAVV